MPSTGAVKHRKAAQRKQEAYTLQTPMKSVPLPTPYGQRQASLRDVKRLYRSCAVLKHTKGKFPRYHYRSVRVPPAAAWGDPRPIGLRRVQHLCA